MREDPLRVKHKIAEIIALAIFIAGVNKNQLTNSDDKGDYQKQNVAA